MIVDCEAPAMNFRALAQKQTDRNDMNEKAKATRQTAVTDC